MRTATWPLAVVIALVLQTTVLEHLSLFGVKPDLVLLLTVFTGLTRGPVAAMLVGYAAGLGQDALSGAVLGSGAWSKAACGTLVGAFRGSVFRDHLLTHFAVAAAATWVAEFAFWAVVRSFRLSETPFPRFLLVALLGSVFNMLLAPSAFWLLTRYLPVRRAGSG